MRAEMDGAKERAKNATGDASVLRARGLRKEFGREAALVRAVDEVDLEVAPGEALAVMGPSGCGKSTVLHVPGGLDRPTGGELWLAGRRIDGTGERALARLRREAIGFVFQAFHLMDELTAAEKWNCRAGGGAAGSNRRRAEMHVAIPLYPGYTALDAVGPYTVLAFAPGWTVTFVAAEPGPVLDDRGTLSILATASFAELPRPDVILVPGGPGTFKAVSDTALLGWISQAHEHTRWTTSVCAGSFLLGAAGLLKGIKATSHWGWLELLARVGAEPVSERVVTEGKIVTAAGVSSGIDMALTLLARASGATTAQTVQLAIEYAPEPPFDAGSPATAPVELREPALRLIGAAATR